MNKVQHVKWCMKQSSLQKSPSQQIPCWHIWQSVGLMIWTLWVQSQVGTFFFIFLLFNAGRILPQFGRKFRIMQKLDYPCVMTRIPSVISACKVSYFSLFCENYQYGGNLAWKLSHFSLSCGNSQYGGNAIKESYSF